VEIIQEFECHTQVLSFYGLVFWVMVVVLGAFRLEEGRERLGKKRTN
jgi:hypothetical protein